jgi:acetylornithine/N-succinyldiaminopimelate aminotransferase
LAVGATDDTKIAAPINENSGIIFLPLNDEAALKTHLTDEVCAVIVEGIQGVGGVHVANAAFLKLMRELCDKTGTVMVLDEVQSGYARSGCFFSHQYAAIRPDLITIAKGMGNGFPVAGVMISPKFEGRLGILGTTFGGNYLACAASIAVLEVIKSEQLITHAQKMGRYIADELKSMTQVKEVRGTGLMIGIELPDPVSDIRDLLLHRHRIFTGASSDKNTLRILPALNLQKHDADQFLESFHKVLNN